MTLRILLTRPLIYIMGLCVVLLGIGTVSTSRTQQHALTSTYIKTSTVASVPTTSGISNESEKNQTARVTPRVPNTPATIFSKHYSVPKSIKNNGSDDEEGYDD